MEARMSSDFLLDDVRRIVTRISANEGWFRRLWMSVPIWQLPEDMIRLQEIVAEVRPQWIIETGTKYGGSAIFFASLLKMIGSTSGGVVTIDLIEEPQAVEVLETTPHPHADLVKARILGDAAAPETAARAAQAVRGATGPVLVFLDDDHNADHVRREMELYSPLVTLGSYLIVADTSFADMEGTSVGKPTARYPDLVRSNPRVALRGFLEERDDFQQDRRFMDIGVGNFPDGFLKRLR
jgi:cephalosporin hydroxylase